MLPGKDKKLFNSLINISRWLLALVIMASGFLKAVDPKGAMLKLQEYADVLSIGEVPDAWLLIGAVAQSSIEFLLGIFLLVGVYRRFVPLLTMLMLLFFTPLSFYLWINGSIDDCGCFGEAVTISNKATFIKNVVLLALSVAVFFGKKRFVWCMSHKCRWMVAIYTLLYILVLNIVSYRHLPVIDSGKYVKGNNLREMTTSVPGKYALVSVYSDGSEEKLLSEGETPEKGWEFLEARSVLVEEGVSAEIEDFSIIDWETDEELSESILSDTGYVCIAVLSTMEKASVSRADKLNDLYSYCREKGARFCAVTSSGEDVIELWRKRTGAEYPVAWADQKMLSSMIHSNPGLLLLKDGVIVGKWNINDVPDIEKMAGAKTGMPDSVWTPLEKMLYWPFWVVSLFGVLFMILLLDVMMVAIGRKRRALAFEKAARKMAAEECSKVVDENK